MSCKGRLLAHLLLDKRIILCLLKRSGLGRDLSIVILATARVGRWLVVITVFADIWLLRFESGTAPLALTVHRGCCVGTRRYHDHVRANFMGELALCLAVHKMVMTTISSLCNSLIHRVSLLVLKQINLLLCFLRRSRIHTNHLNSIPNAHEPWLPRLLPALIRCKVLVILWVCIFHRWCIGEAIKHCLLNFNRTLVQFSYRSTPIVILVRLISTLKLNCWPKSLLLSCLTCKKLPLSRELVLIDDTWMLVTVVLIHRLLGYWYLYWVVRWSHMWSRQNLHIACPTLVSWSGSCE